MWRQLNWQNLQQEINPIPAEPVAWLERPGSFPRVSSGPGEDRSSMVFNPLSKKSQLINGSAASHGGAA